MCKRAMIFQKFLGILYIAGFIISITDSQYTDDADYDDIELMNSKESVIMPQPKFKSYEIVEKVYRYTKHRIPGYDYNEFDFNDDKNVPPRCDDKSIWTHCLCQFTCNKPDTVDCYTPCNSGCECRENYVFHEDMHQCVYPEHC